MRCNTRSLKSLLVLLATSPGKSKHTAVNRVRLLTSLRFVSSKKQSARFLYTIPGPCLAAWCANGAQCTPTRCYVSGPSYTFCFQLFGLSPVKVVIPNAFACRIEQQPFWKVGTFLKQNLVWIKRVSRSFIHLRNPSQTPNSRRTSSPRCLHAHATPCRPMTSAARASRSSPWCLDRMQPSSSGNSMRCTRGMPPPVGRVGSSLLFKNALL